MTNLLLVPVAILYLIVVSVLFIYGLNFFYLTTYTWLRHRSQPADQQHALAGPLPSVTVQLPLFNELYVADRLIDAAARLDYPAELLVIQVLDDSTDETVAIAASAIERARAKGLTVQHLRRADRQGYKAGALQAGLQQAQGEFVAMFDADFVPTPDFLRQTLPLFDQANVAFVQTRWGHLNPRYSLLTRLQALAIDAHFMVEQHARSRAGFWFNFNGTAGIWRRRALEDAGGWKADTLTEDLDISYRAYLRGWQGRYQRDVEVKAELPVSLSAFRRQQHRWARGSLECALKLTPSVWQAPIPLRHKVQATLHLTGYLVHLLLFALALLYPFIILLSQQYSQLVSIFGIAYVFNLAALAPTYFFLTGQQQLGRRWWFLAPRVLLIMVLGTGLMLNTVRATWQLFLKKESAFERTSKFGIQQEKQDWTRQRYQLRLDPIVYAELLLALYNLLTVWFAVHYQNWVIAFYASLFASGLLYVSGTTIWQAVAIFRSQRRPAAADKLASDGERPEAPKWRERLGLPAYSSLERRSGAPGQT